MKDTNRDATVVYQMWTLRVEFKCKCSEQIMPVVDSDAYVITYATR